MRKVVNIKLGTWNVTSMYKAGKSQNIAQEMERLNIDILGISETRWPSSGKCQIGKHHMIYYSGSNDTQHRNGVAVMVRKNLTKAIVNFVPFSERVMLLQIETKYRKMNIVQVYAPTADKDDEEVEQFYEQINTILKITKHRDITIVMGDMNAKVGQGKVEKLVGEYGLGVRNERGHRLIQFCQETNMVITNTHFKLPNRRLYTWISPQDNEERNVRNQIDYVMINNRYRNIIKSIKAYPGADVSSNHNPIIARVKIQLKNIIKRPVKDQIDVEYLRDMNVKEQLLQDIDKNIRNKNINRSNDKESINQNWTTFKNALMTPAVQHLKRTKTSIKKSWMTDEILKLMDTRRQNKNNKDKYQEIQKKIRQQIRRAKETWVTQKCEEIEKLQQKNDMLNLHKKVKELGGKLKQKQISYLVDENNLIVSDTEGKLKMWKTYIQELFEDNRQTNEIGSFYEDNGFDITIEEIENALKNMKRGKSPGPDELPIEVLQLLKEDHITILRDMFNNIYRTGIIPDEWLVSTFVAIPKKTNARHCSEYRTISLMSHTLKLFLKIIHQRIYEKIEKDNSNTQFGFRKGLGTRDALFAYNVLIQRCMDVNQDVYVCFLDYNKAFDKVRHDQLVQLLENKDIDQRDIKIISNLYYNQKAVIRVDDKKTEEIEIKRGVRQGCILSPTLFNLYSEHIFQKALADESAGIKVNGIPINNIRYADDTAIITETLEDLQRIMNKVTQTSAEYGVTLNTKKTKFMVVTKRNIGDANLYIQNERIERVNKYKYLGTIVNDKNEYTKEIIVRIEKARSAFVNMKKVFCSRDLSLKLRTRLVKCYIYSILLYGMEAWTVNKYCMNKIDAFEMWIYRRILKISWTHRVSNVEVLRRMNKEKEITLNIKQRKLQYFGHIMRGQKYQLLQVIMQGKIQGKRSVGRRRMSWLRNLREWCNCNSTQLFRAAVSKVKIAMMVAKLRSGDGT